MRTTGSVLAVAATFLVLAPSASAGTLLDTLTVDPGGSSFAVGTTTLHPGTRYSMDVSGVYQETGPEGYGFKYDALYCYDGVGFDPSVPPQCPHSGSNDKSNHTADISVGVGSTLAQPDEFGNPSTAGHDTADEVPYDPNHSYGFAFYAPETGKLKAGGPFAVQPCPTCQTNFAGGPIVIKLYGPATSGGGSHVETLSGVPVSEGSVRCVPASAAAVFAAAQKMCPFGQVAVEDAPPSGKPVDTSSPSLGPHTKSLAGVIKIDQAAVDREAGWVVDQLDPANPTQDTQKFRDLFEGCLLFGNVEPTADILSIKTDRERYIYFVCAQIVSAQLHGAKSSRRAHAATSTCHAVWIPIWKPHSHPSKRERRAVVAAHNAMQKASCQFGAHHSMTFSVRARHRSLNRALGRHAKSGYERRGSKPDGRHAKLKYSWHRT